MRLARAYVEVALATLPALAAGLAVAGCFTSDAGLSPPPTSFYYPTGLAISLEGEGGERDALYVANSDFDLRYSGGTVQAIALGGEGGVRAFASCVQAALAGFEGDAAGLLPRCEALGWSAGGSACGPLGENADPTLYPGPCGPLGAEPFIRGKAIIGAFASGLLLVPKEDGGARLFIPVRGDPSITYLDIPAGNPLELACGADAEGRCSAAHRVGEDPYESPRALRLPLEPVGMAADPTGQAIVTAHQTQQAASLVTSREGEKPVLQFVLSGLAPGPTELAALPLPGLVTACGDAIDYQPAFLLTYRASPALDLLRYEADEGSQPPRAFLTRAATLGITVNTGGGDSRGIAVDDRERRACEEACDLARPAACDAACVETHIECMATCAEIPIPFFIANRSPASLIIGQARTVPVAIAGASTACGAARYSSAYEVIELTDTVPLAYGPSHVRVGHIIGEDGQAHLRVFAAAFDSRFVFSYDPEARRVDAIIRTGPGPQAIAVDSHVDPTGQGSYSYLYVGHFTDSYIGVVDLDARRPNTFGSMVLTLGRPERPPESQ